MRETLVVNDIDVMIDAENMIPINAIKEYIKIAKKDCQRGDKLEWLEITLPKNKPEEAILDYNILPVQFQRIARITGYLVGSMDRWNEAKKAEAHDRVKHWKASDGVSYRSIA